jgi:hypothetical protein
VTKRSCLTFCGSCLRPAARPELAMSVAAKKTQVMVGPKIDWPSKVLNSVSVFSHESRGGRQRRLYARARMCDALPRSSHGKSSPPLGPKPGITAVII